MPLTDILCITSLFMLGVFITGSLIEGISGELEYRKRKELRDGN